MELVEDQSMDVETLLSGGVGAEGLVNRHRFGFGDSLLAVGYDQQLFEAGRSLDHIGGFIKHDGRLIPVRSGGVDFGPVFPIHLEKIQRNP